MARSKPQERFNANGVCKCAHIKAGTCKQCIACDCCEYFVMSDNNSLFNYGNIPGTHFWGGQVRNNVTWRKGW